MQGTSQAARLYSLDEEVDRYFDPSSEPVGPSPSAVVVMGGVCAGKTTYRRKNCVSGFVNIDAADLFIQLSRGEYLDFPGPLDETLNLIGGFIAQRAVEERRNIAIELTGEDAAATQELLELLQECGYTIKLIGLTCEIEVALQRNAARGDDNVSCYHAEPIHRGWLVRALKQSLMTPLFALQQESVSSEFVLCFNAAGAHLERQDDRVRGAWLQVRPTPPFLEHLSFRLGNQLFFVRLEDSSGRLVFPGSRAGLLSIAMGCGGVACVMAMERGPHSWTPRSGGWGLIDALTGRTVEPAALVTESIIAMSKWELHDLAVQVVRDQLFAEGKRIIGSQGDPSLDPTIWFQGDAGPAWVVVRSTKYPVETADRPRALTTLAARLAKQSPASVGYFASVSIANAENLEAPPWRGHGVHVRYAGLEQVTA